MVRNGLGVVQGGTQELFYVGVGVWSHVGHIRFGRGEMANWEWWAAKPPSPLVENNVTSIFLILLEARVAAPPHQWWSMAW
jgi:hypothetical protein